MKKLFSIFLSVFVLIFIFSSCKTDPYKDYVATGLTALPFEINFEDENPFGFHKAKIICDYSEYASYNFNLSYTKGYFENNNLLVFAVTSCTSDGMVFDKILEEDGKLYPCFIRNYIGEGEPVTDDIIYSSFAVELPKTDARTLGEIIYKHR